MTEAAEEAIAAFYPLHNDTLRGKLAKSWLKAFAFPWQQPYDEIKDYFGEKVALYFRWLGNYTKWLVFPAVFGVAAFVHSRSAGVLDNTSTNAYSVLVSIWAAGRLGLLAGRWRRRLRGSRPHQPRPMLILCVRPPSAACT